MDCRFRYLKHCMQGIFTRMEAPYDTECFESWSQTNYSTKFLGSTIWPYSFMVGKFAKDTSITLTILILAAM